LKNKNEILDEIFGRLTGKTSNDIFLDNVGKLIENTSGLKTIVIEISINSGHPQEKITFDFEKVLEQMKLFQSGNAYARVEFAFKLTSRAAKRPVPVSDRNNIISVRDYI